MSTASLKTAILHPSPSSLSSILVLILISRKQKWKYREKNGEETEKKIGKKEKKTEKRAHKRENIIIGKTQNLNIQSDINNTGHHPQQLCRQLKPTNLTTKVYHHHPKSTEIKVIINDNNQSRTESNGIKSKALQSHEELSNHSSLKWVPQLPEQPDASQILFKTTGPLLPIPNLIVYMHLLSLWSSPTLADFEIKVSVFPANFDLVVVARTKLSALSGPNWNLPELSSTTEVYWLD